MDFVNVSGPVCGFICGEVVEIVGGYASSFLLKIEIIKGRYFRKF